MTLFKRKNMLAKVAEEAVKKNKVVKNSRRVAGGVSGSGKLWFIAIPVVFLMARRTWRKESEKREVAQLKKCRKIAKKRAKAAVQSL